MENNVHVRFCSWSKPLWDKLLELGFIEKGSDPNSMGLKQTKRFYKEDLSIEDSYHGVYLYSSGKKGHKGIEGPRVLKYHGGSVNQELLENFSRKGIYNQ
jgi:hypothetical protein